MRKIIASWHLPLIILSLLLSSTCCLHMARDAYRRPSSSDIVDLAAAVSDETSSNIDEDDNVMLVDPAVLMIDEMTASDNGNQFATIPDSGQRLRSTYDNYLGQSYLLDERPLDLRRPPPRPNTQADEEDAPKVSQRPTHHHYYPNHDEVPTGILRNSPISSPTSGTSRSTTSNRQRHSDTPLSLQALFTGDASSVGGQPEPPPSHLDIRLEQSNILKRAQNQKPAFDAIPHTSTSSGAALPSLSHLQEHNLPASKRASSNSSPLNGNGGATHRSINGESVLQSVSSGGAGGGGGNAGDSGGGGYKGSSYGGMMPQMAHGIASQLMLRSSRGQRNYDVPQIGKWIEFNLKK